MITLDELREDFELYSKHTLILWGCRVLGEKFVTFAKKTDLHIHACCDNDSSKWGTEFLGIPVISPKELEALAGEDKGVLVQLALVPKNQSAVISQLEEMGISNYAKTVENFYSFAHIIPRKFLEKYPNVREDVTPYFHTEISPRVEIPASYEEGLIAVCQPPKTGDITILETCHAHKIPSSFMQHKFTALENHQQRIKITTAIRDPISRDISGIFQELSDGRLCHREELSFEDYLFFLESGDGQIIFDKIYAKSGVKNVSTQQGFFSNFAKNIIDLSQHPFDKEAGYTIIKEGNFDIFFYQLERLNDAIPALSQWMGTPFDALVNSNVADSKWIAKDYKKAQKDLKFSKDYFESSYNFPYLKHCYSEADIEKFKARWEKNVDPKK